MHSIVEMSSEMVDKVGLEPTRISPLRFECSAFASYATCPEMVCHTELESVLQSSQDCVQKPVTLMTP